MSPTKCFKRKHHFLSLYSLKLLSLLYCEDPLLLSASEEKNILCKEEQLWAGIVREKSNPQRMVWLGPSSKRCYLRLLAGRGGKLVYVFQMPSGFFGFCKCNVCYR